MIRVINGGAEARESAPAWGDSLLAIGLVREAEAERLRSLQGRYAAQGRELPPQAALAGLSMLPQWIAEWEAASPALLRADVPLWIDAGLLTPEAAARLLRDAEAVRLPLGSPLAPYLAAAVPIRDSLTMQRDLTLSVPLVREAIEALNRRLDAPLVADDLRIEERLEEGYGGRIDTVRTLAAEFDGWDVRTRLWRGREAGAIAAVLNQALRDRGSAYRAGLTIATTRDEPLAAQAYLVALRESELQALRFDSDDTGSLRHALYRQASPRAERESRACSWLGFQSVEHLLDFEPIRWFGSAPSFADAALARDSVRAAYSRFARAGLVPTDSVDVLTGRFLAQPYGPGDPLGLLAITPALGWYDSEATTVPPDYVGLAEEWAAVSGGAWAPTDLRQRLTASGDSVAFEMRVGGRSYRESFRLFSDWFDGAAVNLFARSARETTDGQFYWLDRGREAFAFLRDEQVHSVRDLFPDLAPVEGRE